MAPQLFPLEAIQEFHFLTQRYRAEYGRSNGGVMNIVTRSGTNDHCGVDDYLYLPGCESLRVVSAVRVSR